MSPAPSTSDADDARKLQDRVRRAKAALDQIGGGEPDPEDLGGPIEIEGADDVLASITVPPRPSVEELLAGTEFEGLVAPPANEVVGDKPEVVWPLTNGLIRVQGGARPLPPSTESPVEDDDEGIVGEWAAGAATITAPEGLVYPTAGWTANEFFVAEPDTTPPPAEPVSRETAGAPVERSKVKIGIIGYTGSRRLAPYGDPEWELWGLNNLHLAEDIDPSKFDAWFDLHPRTDIVKDEIHRRWLEGGSAGLPCFVWGDAEGNPPAEWPNAAAYPTQHILESFPGYFTNSISWMMALAITLLQQRAEEQGVTLADCELGVWGVDMATDGEYAAQRPSCEFLLGIAMGLGLKVEIPDSSDLLKTASLYGLETSPMLAKIDERIFEINATVQAMHEALAQHEAQCRQLEANINAGRGALDQLGYLRGVWFQPTNAGNSTHESPPV